MSTTERSGGHRRGVPITPLGAALVAGGFSIASLGCGHQTVPSLSPGYQRPEDDHRARADSMRATVQALADAPSNLDRYDAIQRRARELKLEPYLYTEAIDWFTLQRNVVIEIPGRTHELVYLVAHYDKSGVTPLVLFPLLTNGLLDEPLYWSYPTQGAVDNGSGVAVVLELAAALSQIETARTYRILLPGAEENGLRGSRAHISRMSDADWARTAMVVNVDAVGAAESDNCVTAGLSEDYLVYRLMHVAKRLGVRIRREQPPLGATTDAAVFKQTSCLADITSSCLAYNLCGGLLPQRSWFVPPRRKAVISFLTCDAIDLGMLGSALFLIPTARFHGPRDNVRAISPERLYEQYLLVLEYLREMERDTGHTEAVPRREDGD